MNNANYSNNKNKPTKPLPEIKEMNHFILKINNVNPYFKIDSDTFSIKKRSDIELNLEKKGIWVYDKGKLI
jgi:hypothetical protein